MRYREGTLPTDAAAPGSDMVTATVLMTLVIGIGFVIAGYRGRQWWLAIWGAITVLVSVVYFVLI